jgi:hypothetical protein
MRSFDASQSDATTRIVRRLVVFCAPIIIAWFCLELWTAQAVPDSYLLKRQRLEAQAKQVDTLITGSSRAYQGIAPKELPGFAFNVAGLSQSLDEDYRLLMMILPKVPRIKRVIIEIQDTSFFYQMHDSFDSRRQYYYQQEWGLAPLEWQDWLDVRMFSRVALRTPQFYRQNLSGIVRSFLKGTRFVPDETLLDIDDRGWWSAVSPTTPDLTPGGAEFALKRHASVMKPIYESPNVAYLNQLLAVLRQRGIDAVLVTLPISPDYSRGMDEKYWARTQADMKSIAAEPGVRYFCFLNVPELGPQDFFDTDHLNRQGAVRFTEMLRKAMDHSSAPNESSCTCCSR